MVKLNIHASFWHFMPVSDKKPPSEWQKANSEAQFRVMTPKDTPNPSQSHEESPRPSHGWSDQKVRKEAAFDIAHAGDKNISKQIDDTVTQSSSASKLDVPAIQINSPARLYDFKIIRPVPIYLSGRLYTSLSVNSRLHQSPVMPKTVSPL